jgi:hypothetical protein
MRPFDSTTLPDGARAALSAPTADVVATLLGADSALAAELGDASTDALRGLLRQATGTERVDVTLLRDRRPFAEVLEVLALCTAQRRLAPAGSDA